MDVKQSEKEWKYDAFISYRHSELDKYVAQTLQKKLEEHISVVQRTPLWKKYSIKLPHSPAVVWQRN